MTPTTADSPRSSRQAGGDARAQRGHRSLSRRRSRRCGCRRWICCPSSSASPIAHRALLPARTSTSRRAATTSSPARSSSSSRRAAWPRPRADGLQLAPLRRVLPRRLRALPAAAASRAELCSCSPRAITSTRRGTGGFSACSSDRRSSTSSSAGISARTSRRRRRRARARRQPRVQPRDARVLQVFQFLRRQPRRDLRRRSAGNSIRSRCNVILPIGISFYTFMTISYVIDVYRREIAPTTNLARLRALRRLFPAPGRRPDSARVAAAAADRAAARDHGGADDRGPAGSSRWGVFPEDVRRRQPGAARRLGLRAVGGADRPRRAASRCIAFAFQIYGDFAGYSNIARGVVEAHGHRAQRQLPVSVLRHVAAGVLAQLAHQPVHVAARLPLHPARRQSRVGRARRIAT